MKNENSPKVEIHDNYKLDAEVLNTQKKYYFIFHQRKLLLVNNQIPLISGLEEIYIKGSNIKNELFIGSFYDNDCFAVELNEDFNEEYFILQNKDNEILEKADLNQMKNIKIDDFYDEAEHNLNIKNIESGKIRNLKIDEMNQSGDEYNKIKDEYINYEELIKFLDEYIEMKGYKAKSHYLCIKKWVVDAVKERNVKKRNDKDFDRPAWLDMDL